MYAAAAPDLRRRLAIVFCFVFFQPVRVLSCITDAKPHNLQHVTLLVQGT